MALSTSTLISELKSIEVSNRAWTAKAQQKMIDTFLEAFRELLEEGKKENGIRNGDHKPEVLIKKDDRGTYLEVSGLKNTQLRGKIKDYGGCFYKSNGVCIVREPAIVRAWQREILSKIQSENNVLNSFSKVISAQDVEIRIQTENENPILYLTNMQPRNEAFRTLVDEIGVDGFNIESLGYGVYVIRDPVLIKGSSHFQMLSVGPKR